MAGDRMLEASMAVIKGKHVGRRTCSMWIALVCLFTISEFDLSFAAVTGNQTIFQFHDQKAGGNSTPEFRVPNLNQLPRKLHPISDMTCDSTHQINSSDVHPLLFGRKLSSQGRVQQNALGTCLVDQPIQLQQSRFPGPVAKSFGTLIRVHAYYSDRADSDSSLTQSGDKGLAFIITSLQPGTINSHDFSNSLTLVFYFIRGFLNLQILVRYNDSSSVTPQSPLTFSYESPLPICSKAGYPKSLATCPFAGKAKFTVWIEYDSSIPVLSVTVGDYVKKPKRPFFSVSGNASLDEYLTKAFRGKNGNGHMFVGFSSWEILNYPGTDASIGNFSYAIDDWSFNSDGPPPDYQRNPYGERPDPLRDELLRARRARRARKVLILSTTVPSGLVFIFLISVIYALYQRNARLHAIAKKYNIIDLESLGRGAQRFSFKELSVATKGFNSSELLGSGGFGSVYRGHLLFKESRKYNAVAVKRISSSSEQGAREFETEVTIIGQVQHRNLVRVLGWCHEKGELLLVYELMPNGSLDQHLFRRMKRNVETPQDNTTVTLTWERRVNIVSGVALALAYLHEEWEQRVIHRDVKCSNIMLDTNFNSRLGDFGLARSSEHGKPTEKTALAGTHGYLAPELTHTLKATVKTDVYSFGTVVLEVATGKRASLPIYDCRILEDVSLVDYVWFLYKEGKLLEAADVTLENEFDPTEMIRLLKIGLLCSHPDPASRPRMREVMSFWRGEITLPPLPTNKPVPVFISSSDTRREDDETECERPLNHMLPSIEERVRTDLSRAYKREPTLSLRFLRSWSAPDRRLHTL